MLDENLLITASRAARGITAAQSAVDEAKRLVEEARLGVESAKAGLADAKAAYDAIISEIAGSGVSAAKARKAVEDMLRIFADIGIVEAPSDEAPAEPKAPRRRKAEPAPASAEVVAAATELAALGEPGVIMVGEASEEKAAAEAQPVEAAESAAEPVVEAVVEAAAPVADAAHATEASIEVEAEAAASAAEIDNQEALREIFEIVETSTDGEDLFISETLIAMLNAAEWYSREHRREPLSIPLYREILNIDFAVEAVSTAGLPEEIKGGLEAVVDAKSSEKVFEWFLYALANLEDGKSHVGYAEFFKPAEVEPEQVTPSASEAVVTVEDLVGEDIVPQENDFIADPEADEPEVDVSDDETLAVDAELVGEDVTNIEEINFLEPAGEVAQPATEPAVERPAATEAPAADPAAGPRRFARPNFLPKK